MRPDEPPLVLADVSVVVSLVVSLVATGFVVVASIASAILCDSAAGFTSRVSGPVSYTHLRAHET